MPLFLFSYFCSDESIAMKNILLSLFFLGFIWAVNPENPVFQSDNAINKGGCLDEDAINFCFDCNKDLGTCLYDNEPSRVCEDARISWKRRWKPDSPYPVPYQVMTYSNCWADWEVTIYDRLGNVMWYSTDPKDSWSGKIKGDYVEAGEYYLSINGETRGGTKIVDIMSEFDLSY
jgi:hypothetical protein